MKAIFKIYQEKKGSRRFRCEDEDFPLGDIYLKKPWSLGKDKVVLTLEEVGKDSSPN